MQRLFTFAVAAMVASLACKPAPADGQRLRFSAFATSAENVLRVQGTVTSTQLLGGRIEYGACSTQIRLYSTPERSGPAVWEGTGGGCRPYLKLEGMSFYASISAPEFAAEAYAGQLPTSVRDGTYYATATIGLVTPRVKSAEIPAGVLVVRR
jgi:hypothetical protein